MPQASQELRDKFPDGDAEAHDVLEQNFVERAGVYRRKNNTYTPTRREEEALDYLFHEWDYCYEE